MGILKTLKNTLFPPRPAGRYHFFQVKCRRCGEILDGRVDLFNEPSQDYEGETVVYCCRKVLVGAGPCYAPVEVSFKFDEYRRATARQITGGEFVDSPSKPA